jgi:hypothetical protein
MGSMTFQNEGCALASLVAPLVMAACGSSGVAGSTSESDGGRASATLSDASVPLPSATAFADVNVDADFTQPVDLPAPATAIAGDSASLVGSWVQLASDGSVCTPMTSPFNATCFHLDIQKDDAGAVEGTIHGQTDPTNNGTGIGPPLMGPFMPATDPSVGYPPNVSPNDYLAAERDPLPNVDYRLLDGNVTNGSFTFWFSPLDLWSTWCALQTPYAWNVGGQTQYFCVPPTATAANTDVGKFDLCTSAIDTGPLCTDSLGLMYPCCFGDGGMFSGYRPECGAKVCECSATQCRASLRSAEMDATLTLEGGRLVGSVQIFMPPSSAPPTGVLFTTFQRASR